MSSPKKANTPRHPLYQSVMLGTGLVLGLVPLRGAARAFAPLDFLYEITGKSVVVGIHNREPNSQPAMQTERLHQVTGRYPGLWSGDFLFKADDINSRWAMIYECQNQWNHGCFVNLMLHVAPPNQPEACAWEGGLLSHLSDDQWHDLTTDGSQLNQLWKSRLDEYAKYLSYLKQHGVQVFFRPLHEMNQAKFWWGGRPGPDGTAKLYRLTHDYLTGVKGLTNLIWVWDMQDMSRDFKEYDPGEKYWDVFAFDVYSSGYEEDWYRYVLGVVGKKPMGIGECNKLPAPEMFAAQPRWSFFMSWAELTFTDNTDEQIRALYNSPRAITREMLPEFSATKASGPMAK